MDRLPKQLIVIGDSSVYGWGDLEGGGWCERLKKDWLNQKNNPITNNSAFDRILLINLSNPYSNPSISI